MRPSARQGPLPFWIHQVVEYGIAAVVASSGARLPQPVLPMVAAVVIVVLAATADGPMAAVHLVKRGPHRVADCVVGIGLIVAAVGLFRRVGSSAALLAGLAGVALLALSWRTNYAPKPVKVKQPRSATRVAMAEVGRRASNAARRAHGPEGEAAEGITRQKPLRPNPSVADKSASTWPQPGALDGIDIASGPAVTEIGTPVTPSSSPAAVPISRGARAEQVGRKAGKYAAVGVKVWRNRKN